MLAIPGQLVSTELSVAGGAHVLSIVLAVDVGTLGDLHGVPLILGGFIDDLITACRIRRDFQDN